MILGSQLAELNKSSVLVVLAESAKKATSKTKSINKIFGNGSFAGLISYRDSAKGLLYTKSRQYEGLSEVITNDSAPGKSDYFKTSGIDFPKIQIRIYEHI